MNIGYKPGNGFLYRLNPLIKGFAVFSGILFFSFNSFHVQYVLMILLSLLAICLACKVHVEDVLLSIRRIWVLLIIVALIQGFRDSSSFDFVLAAESILRIIGVFITAGVYLTISPQSELMYFWEICFQPLSLIGLPARELALVMVIAVRFLPVILNEIERIKMAQIARGAQLEKNGFLASAASLMPLMIPTLSQAIIRAGDLAQAMEARGYRVSAHRTRFCRYRFGLTDFIAALFPTILIFAALFSRFRF